MPSMGQIRVHFTANQKAGHRILHAFFNSETDFPNLDYHPLVDQEGWGQWEKDLEKTFLYNTDYCRSDMADLYFESGYYHFIDGVLPLLGAISKLEPSVELRVYWREESDLGDSLMSILDGRMRTSCFLVLRPDQELTDAEVLAYTQSAREWEPIPETP